MTRGSTDLERLQRGELEIIGRLPWSSNLTFLGRIAGADGDGDEELLVVYKPHQGERPLWDFPPGLGVREVAAYELSEAVGWQLVPETVLRDGPLGVGSVQRYVACDHDLHYFTLLDEGDEAVLDQLRVVCAFDVVANNTDRKSGHCLIDADRRVWAIDHGLAFHAEFKLRTVIWDFAGERLPPQVTEALSRFLDEGLPPALVPLLDVFERDAVLARAAALVREGRFPADPTGRRYPWPLV